MAKSSAQRQKAFRDKHLKTYNSRRISSVISASAHRALQRLSKKANLSMQEIIETLVLSEDSAVKQKLKVDTPEWNDYFLVDEE